MKKWLRFFLSIYFLIYTCILLAQTTGKVIYEELKYNPPIVSTLYFCNEKSIYFNKRGKKSIELTDQDGKEINTKSLGDDIANNRPGLIINKSFIDEEGNTIYINWCEDSLVFRNVLMHDPIIVVEPHLPKINWEITNTSKKIDKFNCIKATTLFRGRKYEAWFTPEIPVPAGPWKLHGLPGLILEASDSSMTFIYKFKSIEIPSYITKEMIAVPIIGIVVPVSEYGRIETEKLEAQVRKINSMEDSHGSIKNLSIHKIKNPQQLTRDDN